MKSPNEMTLAELESLYVVYGPILKTWEVKDMREAINTLRYLASVIAKAVDPLPPGGPRLPAVSGRSGGPKKRGKSPKKRGKSTLFP